MPNKKFLVLFIACISNFFLFSQKREITGRVVYENGKPAVYVNVLLKNTQKGSITDTLGNYNIREVSEGKHELLVSMMGYKSVSYPFEIHSVEEPVELPIIVLIKSTNTLNLVVVNARYSMKLKQENGKLKVNVANTFFENAANAWEGMKKVPLLEISDSRGLKIFNKTAIVEINGIRTRMNSQQLQDYLKSLPPDAIKSIEMQPNPDAAYETEVAAVINIILKRGANNYRLGLNSTHGVRMKYFNKSGANYALNLDNFRVYTNYAFSYAPYQSTGEVAMSIMNEVPTKYNYKENSISRGHNALLNINFDLGDKNNIDLTQIFIAQNADIDGTSQNEPFYKNIRKDSKSHQFQFMQVWKHRYNDSVSLEVGAYEIFKKSESHNLARTNTDHENQYLEGNTPIYIVYADYVNDHKYGTTSLGIKYSNILVENENYTVRGSQKLTAPYQYSEEVFAAYLQHNISLSDSKSLRFGLRSESSFIDYKFAAPSGGKSFSDRLDYTNLLYNIGYNWSTEGKRYYNLTFKKQIQRPNYSYLNPYRTIESDIIYSSGDTSLDPTKLYYLSFYTYKGNWVFYGNAGFIKDFISNVYQVKDQTITSTYRNFEEVYNVGGGFQYNKSFFKQMWTTKTGGSINFFKLEDDRFEIQEATPSIALQTYNNIKFANDFWLDLDFEFYPKSKDGLIEHHSSSRLDLGLTKKIGENFTAVLTATDIFKSDRSWNNTTIPNYYYESKMYYDAQSVQLTLRWAISGKAYENREIDQPEDAAIDRL